MQLNVFPRASCPSSGVDGAYKGHLFIYLLSFLSSSANCACIGNQKPFVVHPSDLHEGPRSLECKDIGSVPV